MYPFTFFVDAFSMVSLPSTLSPDVVCNGCIPSLQVGALLELPCQLAMAALDGLLPGYVFGEYALFQLSL
jgi:hypothetical protein